MKNGPDGADWGLGGSVESPLAVAVTSNHVYLTPEEQRQYDETRAFMAEFPAYEQTEAHNEMMLDWLDMRQMKLTRTSLAQAYKCLFQGEPEPKVMSPKKFFDKVKPILLPNPHPEYVYTTGVVLNNSNSFNNADSNVDDVMGLSGLKLSMKIVEEAWKLGVGVGMNHIGTATKEVKPEPAKDVAPAAGPWYSDIVEISTGRRIKDDLD